MTSTSNGSRIRRAFAATATAAAIVLLAPAAALAGPVTWNFVGETDGLGGLFPQVPTGSPVTMAWTFDDAQVNGCSDSSGVYGGQSIALTLGGYSYTASGFLLANTTLSLGCSSLLLSNMELRLPSWSGPSIGATPLSAVLGPFPPGFFWTDPTGAGLFPSSPPSAMTFEGPRFADGRSLTGTLAFVDPAATPVPEPSTLLLVAAGAAGLLSRRRRHSPHRARLLR